MHLRGRPRPGDGAFAARARGQTRALESQAGRSLLRASWLAAGFLFASGLHPTWAASKPSSKKSAPPPPQVSVFQGKPFFTQEGIASWYGGRWIGRLTANGERYRPGDMTAAHKTLPFGTRVVVTDLTTGRQVVVRINNRGPHIRGRIIDLSVAAARQLGMYHRGLARVRIEAFREIPLAGQPNLKVPRAARQQATEHPRYLDPVWWLERGLRLLFTNRGGQEE